MNITQYIIGLVAIALIPIIRVILNCRTRNRKRIEELIGEYEMIGVFIGTIVALLIL